MKLASLKPNELAVVKDESLIPVGEILARQGILAKNFSMLDLIAQYDEIKGQVDHAAGNENRKKLDAKLLKPPVEKPSKIWAAATNYKRGSEGLGDARGRGTAGTATPEEILEKCFLKPPSAIVGPEEAVVIPPGAGNVFPELELCVVIGKKARNLKKEEAFGAIFGYTIILDMTARSYGSGKGLPGSRCVRKGFETFAPVGP